jgi:hypothetical protein
MEARGLPAAALRTIGAAVVADRKVRREIR